MIIYSVQPVSASVEPNTLTAHETDTAAALTAITPQRRSDRGDMVLTYPLQDTTGRDKSQNGRGWSDEDVSYTLDTTGQQGVVQTYTNTGHGWWNDDDGTASSVRGAGNKLETVAVSMPMSGRVNTGEEAATLTSSSSPGRGGSEGPIQLVPPVAKYWETRVARNGRGAPDDIAHALKAEAGQTGLGDAAPMVLTYHVDKERGLPNDEGIAVREVEVSGTLTADGDPAEKNDRGLRIVTPESHGMVRRLTVTECERLQFLPDGWTIVTAEEVAYEKAWAAKPLAERP